MRQIPTPWQYLINIFAGARLKAAQATGNAKTIAQAEKYYRNLGEDECTFTTPMKPAEALGKYQTAMTVKGRNFKVDPLRFGTGTLLGMVKTQANYLVNKSSLDTNTVTGLYFVVENDQLHLLINAKSNIWEALKLTGYEFAPSMFNVVMYNDYSTEFKADGHIDIKTPIVAGRIYITHIKRSFKPAETLVNEKAAVPAPVDVPAPASEVQETVVLEEVAPVVEETPFVDFKKLGDEALEAVKEAEETPVVEEKKPVQQNTKNNYKKK